MGLLDFIFKKPEAQAAAQAEQIKGYFKLLTGYTPAFTSYNGALYEYEITRAAIHSFAVHCSKLQPEIQGSAYKQLGKRIQSKMNPWMDTTKFLYRTATILMVDNNAFIVPLTDETGTVITGYFPIRPSRSEVMEDRSGRQWLRYTFNNGQKAAIEFDRVGIVNQFLFSNDLFGENNDALYATLQLISTNNQGIIEGVKQSASLRFMARLANVFKPEDIQKERKRFVDENLSSENNSGVLMFDNKYADVKQITSKPYTVDADQMQSIEDNVFNYFGTNKKILQNNFTEEEYNSYYEGKLEPFAIQLSLVLSNMTFTDREIAQGNKVIFSTNRLDYMSTENKINLVNGSFDRGFMSHNIGCQILGLPKRGPEGDKYYIRVEYAEVDKLNEAQGLKGGTETDDQQGQDV